MQDANPKAERVPSVGPPTGSFFSAVLTPYRSLGPNGFLLLMLVIGGLSFGCGLLFVAIGAWPVLGFFGLDVLLVWLAFRHNYRQARAFDEVHVAAETVVLRKISARGDVREYRFNPVWLRLETERLEDEGLVRLRLRSHGRAVEVGEFLNPPDREEFTRALGTALASARRGGPRPGLADTAG